MKVHSSDCAIYNEPAYPAGPCSCGAESAFWAQIDAAWDKVKGTKPDMAEFISFEKLVSPADPRSVIHDVAKVMAEDGVTWGRLTELRQGIWIEGWVVRPAKETEPPKSSSPIPVSGSMGSSLKGPEAIGR